MKKKIDVARAWRDQDYYMILTEEERASLGEHPAGAAIVEDEALASITGGCGPGSTKTPAVTVCVFGGEYIYCN